MRKLLSAAAIALLSLPAAAINLQGYRFTDSYRYSVLDDSLLERFSGTYVLTASLNHIHSPVSISNNNYNISSGRYIKQTNMLTLGYTYYIGGKISVGLDTQIVRNANDEEASFFMGDTVLRGKVNLFREAGWSFSLNPQLFLPTGATNSFAEVEQLAGSISAVGEKHITQRLHLLASLGYFSGRKNIYDAIDYKDLILAQLGVSYDLTDSWNINGEVYRNFLTTRDYGQDEGTYFLTMKHKTTGSLSTYFGAGVAGVSELDRDNYTLFAGIKFSEAEEKPAPKVVPPPPRAPAPAKVSKRDDEKKLGTLHQVTHIYFTNGSAEISSEQAQKINVLVKAYNENPDIKHIVIEGYASKTGSPQRNQILSAQRAEKVKNYLSTKGIPESKLSVAAYGDSALKQYPTEAENRRVEFRIYK
jgi:outer membrane protein OmpA-like peptidoglycan-associated protein/outer membrane protein W